MLKSILRVYLLLLVCAFIPAGAVTPAGVTYAMPVSVLNAGEGDMSSATYRLRSSLGEPVAGVTSSGTSYKLASGFVSAVYVPIIQLTPTQLDFPAQATGVASAVQTIQITNLGAAPLSLSGVTVSGDFAQTNTCSAVVQGGVGCTLSVTFNPTAAGARTGTLTFNSNAPGSPTKITLTGTGSGAGAPGVMTTDVTKRDVVAKGKSNLYNASVTSGQTYVISLTGIMGAAQLKVFNDAALTKATACIAPTNLSNSTYEQPADCTFVATSNTVYATVTGTSYLATANNSYNIRISPHNEIAPAIQGTEASPVEIALDKPFAGSVGSDYSYYLVNTTGTGKVVISMTGLTGKQDVGLNIYNNAKFIGPKLDNPSCFTGQFDTFPESCILPAGKSYYLVLRGGNIGGPFTLMVDSLPGTVAPSVPSATPAPPATLSPGALQQAIPASTTAP